MEKNIAKYQRAAFAYAKKFGFDSCLFYKEWNGYMAFEVSRKEDAGACIGYPTFVLVDDKMNARLSGEEELWNGLFFGDDSDDDDDEFKNIEDIRSFELTTGFILNKNKR